MSSSITSRWDRLRGREGMGGRQIDRGGGVIQGAGAAGHPQRGWECYARCFLRHIHPVMCWAKGGCLKRRGSATGRKGNPR